jgi:flavin-dependent dehydrogenase
MKSNFFNERKHAIVIGGSMAGLLAARVLALNVRKLPDEPAGSQAGLEEMETEESETRTPG